jgi:hypothetical protein
MRIQTSFSMKRRLKRTGDVSEQHASLLTGFGIANIDFDQDHDTLVRPTTFSHEGAELVRMKWRDVYARSMSRATLCTCAIDRTTACGIGA